MAITPRYSWPLPDLPDAPNVPFDMNALAVGIEGDVGAIEDLWVQLGIAGYRIEARSVVGTTDVSGALGVVFAKAFSSTPVVVPSHADPAGAAKPIYMMSATATGFFAGGQWAASVPIRVNYIAIGPAVPATSREGSEPDPFITYIVDPDPS